MRQRIRCMRTTGRCCSPADPKTRQFGDFGPWVRNQHKPFRGIARAGASSCRLRARCRVSSTRWSDCWCSEAWAPEGNGVTLQRLFSMRTAEQRRPEPTHDVAAQLYVVRRVRHHAGPYSRFACRDAHSTCVGATRQVKPAWFSAAFPTGPSQVTRLQAFAGGAGPDRDATASGGASRPMSTR